MCYIATFRYSDRNAASYKKFNVPVIKHQNHCGRSPLDQSGVPGKKLRFMFIVCPIAHLQLTTSNEAVYLNNVNKATTNLSIYSKYHYV